MSEYKKPFLTVEEQIELYKTRGLLVEDEKRVAKYLRNISYYHLSIYAKAYQNNNDKFEDGISFDDILNLYKFDKKLRLLLLDVLERIEMSFKCVLAYEVTKDKNDNYWYSKENHFQNGEEDIEKLLDSIKASREIYLMHYYKKYTIPEYPPAWMFFESLTFGDCAYLARNLYDRDRQIIAGSYKLPKKTAIQMFHSLSHLRNVCAHHSRVWNRRFTMKVAVYKKYKDIFGESRTDSFYAYLVVMQIVLKKIHSNDSWLNKLNDLTQKYGIAIRRMGFPDNWLEKLKSIK